MAALQLKRRLALLHADPRKSAAVAGLRYIERTGPGIRRIKTGKSFRYLSPTGQPIKEKSEIERIQKLAIPPAWTDVWICPSPNGHLQAVGRDAKGRKQYRYHPDYRAFRDATKFGRMTAFVEALPKIRQQVDRDLALPGLPRRKVQATVVRLLETTFARIGNEEYAKQNESFGLTTLEDRHVRISGTKLRFRFRGKSGQDQDIELTDRKLAKIVRECRDLPGYELFQYVDEDGAQCRIDSGDINDYLREVTGEDFTAKDFRTWAGTVLAAQTLAACDPCTSDTDTKKKIVAAVKEVASRLGNRPATCRKYYVHPAVIDSFSAGWLAEAMTKEVQCSDCLKPQEMAVVLVLERVAKQAAKVA